MMFSELKVLFSAFVARDAFVVDSNIYIVRQNTDRLTPLLAQHATSCFKHRPFWLYHCKIVESDYEHVYWNNLEAESNEFESKKFANTNFSSSARVIVPVLSGLYKLRFPGLCKLILLATPTGLCNLNSIVLFGSFALCRFCLFYTCTCNHHMT